MKTLAIALDAADGPLLLRWAGEGELPALRSLIERGATARLALPPNINHQVGWPTIVSGCLPGKHGTYSWRCIRPGTNQQVRAPEHTYRKPFWSFLGAADPPRRTLLLDVPYATRIEDDNITQVQGWGQRGGTRHESRPPGLLAEITARHGEYPPGLDRDHAGRPFAAGRQRRTLERMAATRTKLLSELMSEHEWDLCLAAYFEPHHAGHAFHRYLVPGSWGYDRRRARRHGDALLDAYRAADRGLEELIEAAGTDTDVLVFSPIGMRPATHGLRVLDEVMCGLGYTARIQPSRRTRATATLRRLALGAVPRSIARRIKARLPEGTADRHFERAWEESTDWERTRAFAETEPGHSFVRVAHPPPPDHEQLCEEIAAELRLLEDADSGQPAVAAVLRREEVARGPHADALPDLMVIWAGDGMLRRVRHPRLGVIEEDLRDLPPTEHSEEGFLIAAGPSIRATPEPLDGSVADVAPTILHLLACPIPDDMDGEPLTELLDPGLGAPRRIAIETADDPWAAT